METFKISTTKDLSELKEDVITLKKITSDDINNLKNIVISLHKKHSDDRSEIIPINTYDKNLLYSKTPEINVDFKIVDCSISTLEITNPEEKSFQISYETLADKLKNLKEKEDKTRTNVKNEVEKWQRSVKSLFSNITEWIVPYKENINHEILTFNTSEEATGIYEIPILTIKPYIGNTITFRPIGTFIFGGEGRIDVNIPNFGSNIMLVLHREETKDKWIMIIDKNIQNTIIFQKSQFINLLDEVIPA